MQFLESFFGKVVQLRQKTKYNYCNISMLVTRRCQVRIPVKPDICHRGCAYIVLQTVQMNGVYSAAYGTLNHKEPLKSFKIIVGNRPGFELPSVAILPWLCRKRRKALFTHSILQIQQTNTLFVFIRWISCHGTLFRPLGYERVYLPLDKSGRYTLSYLKGRLAAI